MVSAMLRGAPSSRSIWRPAIEFSSAARSTPVLGAYFNLSMLTKTANNLKGNDKRSVVSSSRLAGEGGEGSFLHR